MDAYKSSPSRYVTVTSRFTAALIVASLLGSALNAQERQQYDELPNFYRINERLYRGAQPGKGGVKKLAELGIKTIVNLRGEDEQTRAEEAEAAEAGLAYFSIPMPGLSRPTNEQVARAMSIIEARENWPVFIHCKRGSDRTGTIIAIYRVSHEDWTANQAISEAKRCGMSWVEFGMKDYISDYYRDRQSARQTGSEAITQQPVRGRSQ